MKNEDFNTNVTGDPGDPGCLLFWGRFDEFAKLVGYILLAVISTPLVLITPFFFLAKFAYKNIPTQVEVFKEECLKAKLEKTRK